jgi:PAP2 superfamily C-terminal
MLTTRGWLFAISIAITLIIVYINESPKTNAWWILLTLFSIPFAITIRIAVGYHDAQPHQRWIAFGIAGAIMGKQLPSFLSVFFVFSGVTIFHLVSRPKEAVKITDNQGRLKAALSALFLTVVLLLDNFSVWVVAATYEPGIQGTPEPLQDNGQIVQNFLMSHIFQLSKRHVVKIRAILNVQWALTASLSVTFGVLDLQMVQRRTVWGITLRALLMLAALRVIRVISFMLTVLPSQNPNCYRQRFPPPPKDWMSWIEVGMRPQSHGGCNDLIVSGHATVLTTFACMITSTSGHLLLSIAVWSMLAIDFCLEVYEGFHYSVDMWLGALIGSMMWRILSPLEKVDSHVQAAKTLKPLSSIKKREILAYSIPAVLAYATLFLVPHNFQSYSILLFLSFTGFQALRSGFTHYLQHSLFCLMFLALGIWL